MTQKEEAFCHEMVRGLKQAEAYRRAFKGTRCSNKSIHERASRLMAQSKIKARIAELRAPVINAVQLDMARRLQELSHASLLDPIDFFDEHGRPRRILDMPEQARRAIAGDEVDPETFVTKLKFVDKRGAIMDYSKLAGDIPSDKHELYGAFTLKQLVGLIVTKEPKVING